MADHDDDDSDRDPDKKWVKLGPVKGMYKISGPFSKEESERIRKAVKEFCAARQISVARLCSECDHKAELKGAWMEIAKVIPERSVQSVYRHGLRQLHPFKRGSWTPDECEMLETLVARLGKKWATIQDKLNRSADACRDKHREMNEIYVRGRWKDNETALLKQIIREHLGVDRTVDVKELGRMVESEGIKIPWSVVSKRMVKRSRLACFKKWQKLTGLHSPSDQLKSSAPPTTMGSKGSDDDSSSETSPRAATVKPAAVRSTKAVSAPRSASHRALTAGAAAALAANVSVSNPMEGTMAPETDDSYLLSELAAMDVARMSDVEWENIRGIENAQERWMELFEELQTDIADDSVLSMPLSSVAQMILDRKTSAQQAAETVEAVDLPNPESLQTREV